VLVARGQGDTAVETGFTQGGILGQHVQQPDRALPRGRRWGPAVWLVTGGALALAADRAWTPAGRAASRPDAFAQSAGRDPARGAVPTVAPGPTDGPVDDLLPAHWDALRLAFLEAAAPVSEALERTDRLRAELPALRAWVRETEAAYVASRQARERSEYDQAWYVEVTAWLEEQSNRLRVAGAESDAVMSQARLENFRRSRQQLADLWVTKGTSREAAQAAAAALFFKDIKAEELRAEQAQIALNRVRIRYERVALYTQPKRAKELLAEVYAWHAEELAWQAAWEKAKAELSQAVARLAQSDLSRGESRLLDLLVEVIGASGAQPPQNGNPADLRAFLDRFEAGLAEARTASRALRAVDVAGLYNALVDRLLRTRDGPEE
jgi:hypothetical protein